ncbi:venom serine carboxypeptidase-like [Pieris rapae]|uniref:venom serine carboxypeptidase-like n=1 Tax=Pieris rapae TaxID=64459 RepID=UPI001E28177F|nr:venom serine carboxypeptidase-like [Pieris rapae]
MRFIIIFLIFSSAYAKVLLSNDITELNTTSHIDLPTYKPPVDSNIEPKCDSANDVGGMLACPEIKVQDNGTALILTPYIKMDQIAEARKLSEVAPKLFEGVKSYSGFFTVDEKYDSNSFFWYFPVEGKQVYETPWIIWLQGGPGVSSLSGLFEEIGPLSVSKLGAIKRNPFTWLRNHSILFIDNPIGSGYSFTNHPDGYVTNMATYSKHLFSTVEQFLHVFPELRSAPLYIAGESYAGKYVPALGVELHRAKRNGSLNVNLQGFLIGNALVDPSMMRNMNRIFYYMGLVTEEHLKAMEPLMKAFRADIDAKNSVDAQTTWKLAFQYLIRASHQEQPYNFLKDKLPFGEYSQVLKSSEIKKAIHVGDIKYSSLNLTVYNKMVPDFLSSSQNLFEELLDNDYRVLSYCGHLDLLIPCISSAENHRTWQWRGRQKFIDSQRSLFMYNHELAGWYKSGGNLTEAVVRGAGHLVPADQPGRAQHLITNWIYEDHL